MKAPIREEGSPVYSACNRAFVCENTRYSALIFGGGPSDESRVVDDAILRRVSLRLESSEESLENIRVDARISEHVGKIQKGKHVTDIDQ